LLDICWTFVGHLLGVQWFMKVQAFDESTTVQPWTESECEHEFTLMVVATSTSKYSLMKF
jgi:hypothetical protein